MPLIYNLKYSVEENENRVKNAYQEACATFKGDKELLQDLTRLRDFGLQLAHFAPEYDAHPDSPGNGFRSCLDHGILFLRYGCKKYHESPYTLDDFKKIVKNLSHSIPAVKRLREATKHTRDVDTDPEIMVSLFKEFQESWESVKHFYSYVGTFDLGPTGSTALIGGLTSLIWSYSPSFMSGFRILTDDEYRRNAMASIVFKANPRKINNGGLIPRALQVYFNFISWWSMGSYPDVMRDIEVPRQQEFQIKIDPRAVRSFIERNENTRTSGSITCRLLRDSTIETDTLMLNYHGGGFVLGNRYSNDSVNRFFINKLPEMAIVSVEYSLAPQSKFPTQVQECLDAYLFFASEENYQRIKELIGFIPKKIIISGDSAGGSLASSVMIALSHIRKIEPRINLPRAVFLIYPLTSLYPSMKPSFLTNARSPMITPYGLLKMVPAYLPDVREMVDENQNPNSVKDSPQISKKQELITRIPFISRLYDNISWLFSSQDWTLKPSVWSDSDFQRIIESTAIARDPIVSSIFYEDFESLRDVSLFTYSCSMDGLLDDGVLISKRWKGPSKFTVMNNLQHAFMHLLFREDSIEACGLIVNDLRSVIAESDEKFELLSNNNM